ncbi:hypothetical protein ACJX0J_011760, partial [Zea mays]
MMYYSGFYLFWRSMADDAENTGPNPLSHILLCKTILLNGFHVTCCATNSQWLYFSIEPKTGMKKNIALPETKEQKNKKKQKNKGGENKKETKEQSFELILCDVKFGEVQMEDLVTMDLGKKFSDYTKPESSFTWLGFVAIARPFGNQRIMFGFSEDANGLRFWMLVLDVSPTMTKMDTQDV